ncbi:MAG: hypothetical protein ABIG44_03765 [Planctomycetota bacterium]
MMEVLQRRFESEYPQVQHWRQWSLLPMCGTVGGCLALAMRLYYDVPATERTHLEQTMRRVLQQRFPDSERAYEDCYQFVTEGLCSINRANRGQYVFVMVATWVISVVSEGMVIDNQEHITARIAEIYQNQTAGFWNEQVE